jgi:hypothetical protein
LVGKAGCGALSVHAHSSIGFDRTTGGDILNLSALGTAVRAARSFIALHYLVI